MFRYFIINFSHKNVRAELPRTPTTNFKFVWWRQGPRSLLQGQATLGPDKQLRQKSKVFCDYFSRPSFLRKWLALRSFWFGHEEHPSVRPWACGSRRLLEMGGRTGNLSRGLWKGRTVCRGALPGRRLLAIRSFFHWDRLFEPVVKNGGRACLHESSLNFAREPKQGRLYNSLWCYFALSCSKEKFNPPACAVSIHQCNKAADSWRHWYGLFFCPIRRNWGWAGWTGER